MFIMIKKITPLSFIFLFSFFLGLFPYTVYGQNKAGQVWRCLSLQEKKQQIHAKWLKRDGFPVGQEIYIVSSTSTDQGVINTSGDKGVDDLLGLGPNNGSIIMKYIQGGPKMTTTDGTIEVVIGQDSTPAMKRKPVTYFGVYFPVIPTSGPTGIQTVGEVGGQQLATFNFETISAGDEGDQVCTSIVWDPEGRVFDVNTLEPMPNVSVTVLNDLKQKVVATGVVNPALTDDAGVYAFYVPEGDYYLQPGLPTGYRMITAPSEIHVNYGKAYYDIYLPDEKIVERIDTPSEKQQGYPDVEHRDVGLISDTGRTVNPLKVIARSELAVEGQYRYSGQVSHPVSAVTIKQGETTVYEGSTDKYGYYQIALDPKAIDPTASIDVQFTKIDLTQGPTSWLDGLQRLMANVYAQESDTVTIKTQPILRTLNGRATDANGDSIPNAIIRLKLSNNNSIFYETKADDNGIFMIESPFIPIFPYYLEFVSPTGKAIKQETSEFAQINKEFVEEQKVNLQKDMLVKVQPTGAQTKTSSSSLSRKTSKQTNTDGIGSLIPIVLGILVLGLVGVVIVIKLKNRGTVSTDQMM